MDIIDFFKKQVDIWNETEKCGLCFEFSAPLIASQVNIVQSETCCVHIFLTDVKFREEKVFNPVTGLITSKRCIWNFSLYALIKEQLGVNNYNEIKGHSVDESKWNTIYLPLINCLGCDNLLDLCEILGKQVQVTQTGDAVLIHNYLDEGYNGWRVNYQFSEIT